MTGNSMHPPAGGPAWPLAAAAPPPPGRPLLAVVVIIVGSVLLGLAGGALWAGVAPRVVYQVVTLKPPTAYAVNAETSAFIATDGWYCFIALAGGALIGLLSYLFAVRRYGPAPMTAVVIGSAAAAFVAQWAGHQFSGGPGFDRVLATSQVGELLHAPISLGSHGALAFWPVAAAIVAGGLELISVLRIRRLVAYGSVPMPGTDAYGSPPAPGPPGSGGWPDQTG
ncbi:MAG: hypothetical protein ACLQFR_25825 [Streptosporangiaceae bacterium]